MQRSARMLPVARQIVDVVHFVHTAQKDMVTLVHELIKADALTDAPERKYKYYRRFKRSPLMCIQMAKFCQWINQHKYELKINRKAR